MKFPILISYSEPLKIHKKLFKYITLIAQYNFVKMEVTDIDSSVSY